MYILAGSKKYPVQGIFLEESLDFSTFYKENQRDFDLS